MDVVKEVGALILKIRTACETAKTNKTSSEELLRFASLVKQQLAKKQHRPSLQDNALRAVQKACATVERVTQRGAGGTLSKVKGALQGAWSAEQDLKDLEDSHTELMEALALLGHDVNTDILREFQGLAEQDARASQKILDTLAEMDAKSDRRHEQTMDGIGELQRDVKEILQMQRAAGQTAAAGAAPRGGQRARSGSRQKKRQPADVPAAASTGQPAAAATSGGSTTFPGGAVWVGQLKNGKAHGEGCFSFPDGEQYIGQLENGLRHGQGTMSFPSGEQYIGQFENGLRHGQGKMTICGGEATYEGQWRQGKRHGSGTLDYLGEKYVGEWQDGRKHGQGVVTYPSGRQDRGRFEKGKFVG